MTRLVPQTWQSQHSDPGSFCAAVKLRLKQRLVSQRTIRGFQAPWSSKRAVHQVPTNAQGSRGIKKAWWAIHEAV